MIVLSIIICLFGIIYTYGANSDPAMSRAQREDMRKHNGMLNGGISGLVDAEMSRRGTGGPLGPAELRADHHQHAKRLRLTVNLFVCRTAHPGMIRDAPFVVWGRASLPANLT